MTSQKPPRAAPETPDLAEVAERIAAGMPPFTADQKRQLRPILAGTLDKPGTTTAHDPVQHGTMEP